MHLSTLFSDGDRERINETIRQAESRTSAEIVPVVARSSGRYDRPEDIVGLWVAMLGAVVVWTIFPNPGAGQGGWAGFSAIWEIAVLLATMLIGFVAGAFAGSRIDWLRRLFTPREQMRDEVFRRAQTVFFDRRVHHTASASGVLLYVSVFERMAAVIADEVVMDKLGQPTIDEICREFTNRLHNTSPMEAICETAQAIADQLASPLPRAEDDVNELPNALVLIDDT